MKDLTDEEQEALLNGDEEIISKYFFSDSDFLDTIPFYYTTIDGDNIDTLHGFGGNSSSEDSYFYGAKQHRYEQITPFDDIESVTFGDFTINVNDIQTQITEFDDNNHNLDTQLDSTQVGFEKTEFTGVLKSTKPLNLGDIDYTAIEEISIMLDYVDETTYDFEDFFNKFVIYGGTLKKGEPIFDEFLGIYSSYTLQPFEYRNEDAKSFIEIERLMIQDLDFLYSNQFEAPITKIELVVWGEERELLKMINFHSNGVAIDWDYNIGYYIPYTMGELGIEFKEKLSELLEKYPDSFQYNNPFNN